MMENLLKNRTIETFTRNNSKIRPFCRYSASTSASTVALLLLLIPQLVMLYLTGCYSSLYITAASVLALTFAESINSILRKKHFYGATSILKGILTGLLLPSNMPVIPVFFLVLISSLVFDYAFGGYSHSWINPVAITVALAWILDVKNFPSFLITEEQLISHNPSLLLIQNGSIPILPFDKSVTAYLNLKIFNHFGISIPEGYVSLLWDNSFIIPAFRFNILTLISSAVLFAFDFVSFIIPACYVTVYSLLVYFVSQYVHSGISSSGDVILAVMTSGTLFCSVFLLAWMGTTPVTTPGKIIYGAVAGVIAFFIVGCGTSPAGTIFTVILVNIISLLLQQTEYYFEHRKLSLLLQNKLSIGKGEQNA